MFSEEFSKFEAGYRNRKGIAVLQTRPSGLTDIPSTFNYITSDAPKLATLQLRSMIGRATDAEISDFKKLNFKIVVFAESSISDAPMDWSLPRAICPSTSMTSHRQRRPERYSRSSSTTPISKWH